METYAVLNHINNKVYVGWTTKTACERFRVHCKESNTLSSRRFQTYFHKAIRKYGADAFEVLSLWTGDYADEAKRREIEAIAVLGTQDRERGYNLTAGGEGTSGYKMSADARKRLSVYLLKHPRKPWLGKTRSDEWKARLSQKLMGRIQSPESTRKRSETNKVLGIMPSRAAAIKGGQVAGVLNAHNRWHVNRNLTSAACALCQGATNV